MEHWSGIGKIQWRHIGGGPDCPWANNSLRLSPRQRSVTMKINKPRHPIAVIGSGIAGLAAANTLRDMQVPCVLVERFGRPGGRMNTRPGDGWTADHGTRYIRRSDQTLAALIRSIGYEQRRVSVQGGVHRLLANGTIEVPPHGGLDLDRMCLDLGFNVLTAGLAHGIPAIFDAPVAAIRWDNSANAFWWEEGQVFWFEDDKGEPIRDRTTREVLKASGVILATTGTAAHAIAENSPALHDLVPALSAVKYDSCYAAIFKVPRQQPPFYALEGAPGARIAWLAFEDAKAPERAAPEYSVVVVQASAAWSAELMAKSDAEAIEAVYTEARAVLSFLPESPISQTYKRWNVSQLVSAPIGLPDRWPVNPESAPFSLAGDYVLGPRAEDAARSGVVAARQVVAQLPARRSFLGLELGA